MANDSQYSGNTIGSHEDRAVTVPAWQRIDRWFLDSLERFEGRYGVLAAALITAVIAEAISILFAATIYDQHHSRFTGLSANPFAFGEVDIPYPEHRLRILGPVVAWAIGLRGKAGAYVPIAFNIPLLMLFYVVLRHRTTRSLAVVFTLLMATTHVTMESRTLIGYHDT